MPDLARITIYPVKSLDGIDVTNIPVLQSGALQHDREFAIFDQQGRFVNGKRNAKVHLLRTLFDLTAREISIQVQGTNQTQVFHLDRERAELETWLSNYFDFPVKLKQNSFAGFPDDTNASGPTIISTATITEVASWFPDISVEQMRSRIRANLEIGGVPPFWEDRLFAEADKLVQFQVGEVLFAGVNPCQRCVVLTRDAITATAYPSFQKQFMAKRQATMPSWVEPSRFNHFFRLSVNTQVSGLITDRILRVGDEVKILATVNSDRQS